MFKVSIVTGKLAGYYINFLIPLIINRKSLKHYGIQIDFCSPSTVLGSQADVYICLSSLTSDLPGPTDEDKTNQVFELLEALRHRSNKLFWFDISDSSGSNQFRYLPYVDKFLKAYVLTNLNKYQEPLYRDRLYTDYYHRQMGVTELKPPPVRELPQDGDLHKIQLGWGSAIGDYGPNARIINKIYSTFTSLPFINTAKFQLPNSSRTLNTNMRFSTNYNRASIAFQRQQLQLQAEKLNIPMGRVSRKVYMTELKDCKICVSPFGWGEVCFRDFESILSGAALMKPDMSHMQTWPNLYKSGQTYISFKWDLTDFEEVLEDALQNDTWIKIVTIAQASYKQYLFEKVGKQAFIDHFLKIIEVDKA